MSFLGEIEAGPVSQRGEGFKPVRAVHRPEPTLYDEVIWNSAKKIQSTKNWFIDLTVSQSSMHLDRKKSW